jgi:hypothetical protein
MVAVARMEGISSNHKALCLPSVISRAALSRWALVRAAVLQDGSEEVVVRHTFLEVPGTPEVTPKRRAMSAPPPPDSCDREADTWCALTYKHRPLERSVSKAKGGMLDETVPSRSSNDEEDVSPSESTATPDMDSASVRSGAVSEEVVENRPCLSQLLPDTSQTFFGGDFLQTALASTSSEWSQIQVGVQTQVPACSVPRDANGMPTSIGSIGHMQGMCKPCVFANHATKVCMNGVACPFCHFEHPPKQKRRLCRQRHS